MHPERILQIVCIVFHIHSRTIVASPYLVDYTFAGHVFSSFFNRKAVYSSTESSKISYTTTAFIEEASNSEGGDARPLKEVSMSRRNERVLADFF